jgi:uncharacterized protein YutD
LDAFWLVGDYGALRLFKLKGFFEKLHHSAPKRL